MISLLAFLSAITIARPASIIIIIIGMVRGRRRFGNAKSGTAAAAVVGSREDSVDCLATHWAEACESAIKCHQPDDYRRQQDYYEDRYPKGQRRDQE